MSPRHGFAVLNSEEINKRANAPPAINSVYALVGHSSTKITEKSCAHWVKGRQEKLEDAVKNSWANGHSRERASTRGLKTLVLCVFLTLKNGGGRGVELNLSLALRNLLIPLYR